MTTASINLNISDNSQIKPKPFQASPISEKLFAAFSSNFSRSEKKGLSKTFSSMPADQLVAVLDEFFFKISHLEVNTKASACNSSEIKEWIEDLENAFNLPAISGSSFESEKSLKFLQELAELIPFEKLEEVVKTQFKSPVDALHAAKAMIREAKDFLEKNEIHSGRGIQARMLSFLSTFLTFIDSLVSAFGIAEFFKPAEGEIQADFKLQKIFVLLSLFTFLTATLLPMLGVTTSSSIVGGSLLFIAVLSLIWPKIRPILPVVPGGKNWSEEYREGKLKALGGREIHQDHVASVIATNKEVESVKEHILVTGPSGIGKTELGKNLVQAIERGDYPELKEMEVIYFNTADIVSSKEMFTGQNKILNKIVEAIKHRKKNTIIILDEIHLACKIQEDSVIGDQLKTILDTDFPNVIGFTTEEEFVTHIYENNSAFFRRFVPINIGSTEPKETKEILKNFFLKNAPKGTVLDHGTLDYIIEQTKDAPQPLSALKILSHCIRKITKSQKTPLDKKVKEKQREAQALDSEGAVASFSESNEQRMQKILQLQQEFQSLIAEWKNEKKKVEHLFQIRDFYGKVKNRAFQTVEKIAQYKKATSNSEKKEVKNFVMLRYFAGPFLEKQLRQQSQELNIKLMINHELIDEVLSEKKETDSRVQESIVRAREAIRQRKEKV